MPFINIYNEIVGRVIFSKGEQRKYIEEILKTSGLSLDNLALVCGVSSRTFRDWKREKFSISQKAVNIISHEFHLDPPIQGKVVDDHWYIQKASKMGGQRKYELYGPPGSIESRKKGGVVSQLRRKQNPERYRKLGCNVRKEFATFKKSIHLAEMTGIILGDGGITKYQLKITLDKKTDILYIPYVCNLANLLFGEKFNVHERNHDGAVDLSLSGINLIESLSEFGLEKGNKIKRQIDFPRWIWEKDIYQIKCVRGLVDTDGCVFIHRHEIKGTKYQNLGIGFTSKSIPLLKSVSKVLLAKKIKHFVNFNEGAIRIYDLNDIVKYSKIIGFSNPKHKSKLQSHLLYNHRLD